MQGAVRPESQELALVVDRRARMVADVDTVLKSPVKAVTAPTPAGPVPPAT
jgi:hypothetical protein